jgi:Ca2+-binding RTX toxin-like protein
MFLLADRDNNGTPETLIISSETDNIDGDPFEFFGVPGTGILYLAIAKYNPAGGPNPSKIKYVDFSRSALNNTYQFATNSSTSFGHNQSANGQGVAAAFYQKTPAFGTNPPVAEPFTSLGGTPILFDKAGNRLATPVIRNQPAITAPDGVVTTLPSDSGLNPFFGTSAAAPHAAGVAALIRQKVPSATNTQIYNALKNTAVDMNTPGYDFLTGTGLIQADAAIAFLVSNTNPTLAIAATNANQTEGNIGTKAFTFTVTRSGTTTGANNVNWAVTGSGTNPANATDFAGGILQSGIVNFAAGDTTSKVITVNVQGDTTVEPNENFTVTLSNPTNGATITTATALGTIQNDDGVTLPTITLASNYSGVSENGKTNLIYTFNRTGATTSPLTVNFGVGGTATRNSDYAAYGGNFPTATTGNVTFAAGATTAQLVVVTSGDTVKEVNETIALTLASGTGYQIGTIPTVTTTILNDDGVLNQKGTTGNDVLEAGSTPILSGKAGNDILIGSRASDILVGGTGNDTLTTGTGFDTVLFSSKTEGIDVITDFNVTEDIFQVSAAAFGGGLVAGESISAAQFSLSLASVSTTTRFIFDKPTGKLFFDLDGNGATAAIQIASLTANLNLTEDNIFAA